MTALALLAMASVTGGVGVNAESTTPTSVIFNGDTISSSSSSSDNSRCNDELPVLSSLLVNSSSSSHSVHFAPGNALCKVRVETEWVEEMRVYRSDKTWLFAALDRFREEDSAARIIQAAWRGHLVRRMGCLTARNRLQQYAFALSPGPLVVGKVDFKGMINQKHNQHIPRHHHRRSKRQNSMVRDCVL